MKKLVTGIAAAVLALSMCSMTVFAAQTFEAHYYVDDNLDGICDYCGISTAFVDANSDGICDNYALHSACVGSHGCGARAATGYGRHHGGGCYYGGGGYYGGGYYGGHHGGHH